MPEYKKNFWDERYSGTDYTYGTEPNLFFKDQLDKIIPQGKLLLPGEGEGRNAVYAAKLGWKVDAFDQSQVAKSKANKLAKENNVSINYETIDLEEFKPKTNYYDCAAIIFVHLPLDIRSEFYKKVVDSIKPAGKIILELFSTDQLGKNSGGPQNLEMLSTIADIKNNFDKLRPLILKEENIYLDEGDKHSGEASVIRFVGEKAM